MENTWSVVRNSRFKNSSMTNKNTDTEIQYPQRKHTSLRPQRLYFCSLTRGLLLTGDHG